MPAGTLAASLVTVAGSGEEQTRAESGLKTEVILTSMLQLNYHVTIPSS